MVHAVRILPAWLMYGGSRLIFSIVDYPSPRKMVGTQFGASPLLPSPARGRVDQHLAHRQAQGDRENGTHLSRVTGFDLPRQLDVRQRIRQLDRQTQLRAEERAQAGH